MRTLSFGVNTELLGAWLLLLEMDLNQAVWLTELRGRLSLWVMGFAYAELAWHLGLVACLLFFSLRPVWMSFRPLRCIEQDNVKSLNSFLPSLPPSLYYDKHQ